MADRLNTVEEYRTRAADIRTRARATTNLAMRARLVDLAADDEFSASALELVQRMKRVSKVEPSSDPTDL